MVLAVRNRGVQAALLAAVLFGAGTPIAKLLLGQVSPWLLAGLLYCGSGLGLGLLRLIRHTPAERLHRHELPPLVGAVLFGGVVGPVLLMLGLFNMPASGASLLLNAEGVFTAVLAWWVFKENFDRRIALGMLAIVGGAVILSVPSGANLGSPWPALAVLGACLAWGLDNNLTRKLALHDATWLAFVKGAVAGPTNLLLAFTLGAQLPGPWSVTAAMAVGFLAYGVSLVLFIVGMRHLGTARAGAYYAIAPFLGAVVAVALGDKVTWPMLLAGVLMATGAWLHLTERHHHRHVHPPAVHDHWHTHDEHHRHEHAERVAIGARHKHQHTHQRIAHSHDHYPDMDHRHDHSDG